MAIKSENDKEIICRDCNEPFTWTEGEQKFYADKNLYPPVRCPDCRTARKLNKPDSPEKTRTYGYRK